MHDFQSHCHAAQHRDFGPPVELGVLARMLAGPCSGVAPNGVKAALVAQRPQLFEPPDQRRALARSTADTLRQRLELSA